MRIVSLAIRGRKILPEAFSRSRSHYLIRIFGDMKSLPGEKYHHNLTCLSILLFLSLHWTLVILTAECTVLFCSIAAIFDHCLKKKNKRTSNSYRFPESLRIPHMFTSTRHHGVACWADLHGRWWWSISAFTLHSLTGWHPYDKCLLHSCYHPLRRLLGSGGSAPQGPWLHQPLLEGTPGLFLPPLFSGELSLYQLFSNTSQMLKC